MILHLGVTFEKFRPGMKDMLDGKISELMAGASTAWVPSPAAATLHSLHYHHVNVPERQMQLAMRPAAKIELLLEPPLLAQKLTDEEIGHELKENAQSILGYVVRWIDLGIGCSKVGMGWKFSHVGR